MLLRINLVTILVTLNCVSHATEHSKSALKQWQEKESSSITSGKDLRYTYNNVTSKSPIFSINERSARDAINKIHRSIDQNIYNPLSKIEIEERETRRKKRKAGKNAMMALLMAYKLKFIALIPTIIGGLILLKATTLLAGFFFALFAAVLGLKVH